VKTDDEVRERFVKYFPSVAEVANHGVGPFTWFLAGFRAGESVSAETPTQTHTESQRPESD
jgi:hypothetical protein